VAIHVLACDDQPLYRQALAALLEHEVGIEVVGLVESSRQALAVARRSRPHVVLLDIASSQIDGIELIATLQHEMPETNTLVLSGCDDPAIVFRALAAGALGYLVKTIDAAGIVAAIRDVAAGKTVLSHGLGPGLADEIRSTARSEPTHLTEREHQILGYLCDGRTAPEIARQLFLGASTVRTHLAHLYEKLGVSNRSAAVAKALRYGLVE
jgi:two-component system nitrate/nitrite response regulator NarL